MQLVTHKRTFVFASCNVLKKRELCTESETRALITAWGDQIQDNINISQRNADVYVDFAKAVTKQVFPGQDRK